MPETGLLGLSIYAKALYLVLSMNDGDPVSVGELTRRLGPGGTPNKTRKAISDLLDGGYATNKTTNETTKNSPKIVVVNKGIFGESGLSNTNKTTNETTKKQKAKPVRRTHEERVQTALDYISDKENRERLQAIHPRLADPEVWEREIIQKFLAWSETNRTKFAARRDYRAFFGRWCKTAQERLEAAAQRQQKGSNWLSQQNEIAREGAKKIIREYYRQHGEEEDERELATGVQDKPIFGAPR